MEKTITIIGSGRMAKAIATQFKKAGYALHIHARNEGEAMALCEEIKVDSLGVVSSTGSDIQSDVVVFAVPYTAQKDVVTAYAGKLEGKVIIEISNPIDTTTSTLIVPPEGSSAEALQALLPGSNIVKAFNTTFARVLIVGNVNGTPLDVFVAGNNEASRTKVISIVDDLKLRGINAGELKNARYLEGFQLVHTLAQKQLGTEFGSAIKIIS